MAAPTTPSRRHRTTDLTASPVTPWRHQSASQGSQRNRSSQSSHLPLYERQVAQLNQASQQYFEKLTKSAPLKCVLEHLDYASTALIDTVGDVNAQLAEARIRREKQQIRFKNSVGNDVPDDGEADARDSERNQKLEQLEESVGDATSKLESTMRKVVDSKERLNHMQLLLGNVLRELDESAARPRTQSQRAGLRQSRKRRAPADEEEEEVTEEQDEEEESTEGEEEEGRPDIVSVSEQLATDILAQITEWVGTPLEQRYGRNQTYRDFYKTLHESKFNGVEIPPLPAPSTWFEDAPGSSSAIAVKQEAASMGTRTPQQHSPVRTRNRGPTRSATNKGRQGQGTLGDEDDIAIQHERVSITCPLTLQPFINPATSTKCQHTFERSAIESMIRQSNQKISIIDKGVPSNVKCVECPVCSTQITLRDLRLDPVQFSRVRKATRLAAMQQEDEEEQRGGGGGRAENNDDEDEEEEEEEEEQDEDDEEDGDGDAEMNNVASLDGVKQEQGTLSREISVVPNTQF